MNTEFNQIFNFNYQKANMLYNSSYLEDLTGLIEKAAENIDAGTDYYFDSFYYLENNINNSVNNYDMFIESIRNSFNNSSSNKVNIIRGLAGIGKTSFFEKGVQKIIRENGDNNDNYIELGIDFKNLDQNKDIEFYKKYIFENLNRNAITAIRKLGDKAFDDFYSEYKRFCREIFGTVDEMLFPVMFFCRRIYQKYSKPCIIILDNIDLACVDTQVNVFKATAVFCTELNKFMKWFKLNDTYRIYFAMRPETFFRSNEMRIGTIIDFPLPNILAISLEIIKSEIISAAEEMDEKGKMKCEVTYYDIVDNKTVMATTFSDVAEYFNKIFEHFLNTQWSDEALINRLGANKDFHCNIVNYNIRTFLSFLSDTLSNGGFKPLTKAFNENGLGAHYSVFDYIEMIIRGRWAIHPGNKNIDNEGGNKAPIIFNMFDSSLWYNTQESKVKHFMLYIRILQYFNVCINDDDSSFGELIDVLSNFFDEELIISAVQELVFTGFLYSSSDGDNIIASKKNRKEIKIEDNTNLSLSPKGRFYLEKFICEFEYLYQMALSSIMPTSFVDELSNCWFSEKEFTVLKFLMGMFYIIKNNVEQYERNNVLPLFSKMFCKDDDISCKPFRRILDSFITAMERKVVFAEKYDTKKITKLQEILASAQELQNEASKFFCDKLGEGK